jgi:hypothetical protein
MNDLNKISVWAKIITPQKPSAYCSAINELVSPTHHTTQYMDGQSIENVENHKHLEIHFSNNGHWGLHIQSILIQSMIITGCGNLEVVLSLSIREVVSSSTARADRVKPTCKTFKIGSNYSFAKSAFTSENHGSFGYELKNGGPVLQQMWYVKEPSLLKAISAKFAALSPVMVTAAR